MTARLSPLQFVRAVCVAPTYTGWASNDVRVPGGRTSALTYPLEALAQWAKSSAGTVEMQEAALATMHLSGMDALFQLLRLSPPWAFVHQAAPPGDGRVFLPVALIGQDYPVDITAFTAFAQLEALSAGCARELLDQLGPMEAFAARYVLTHRLKAQSASELGALMEQVQVQPDALVHFWRRLL